MTVTLTFTDDDGPQAIQDALDGWKWRSAYERVEEAIKQTRKHNEKLDPTTLDMCWNLLLSERPE